MFTKKYEGNNMTFVWKHPKYYKELIKQQRDPRHNQWGNLGEPKNHEDVETQDLLEDHKSHNQNDKQSDH